MMKFFQVGEGVYINTIFHLFFGIISLCHPCHLSAVLHGSIALPLNLLLKYPLVPP